jgi:hypothetical protein
MNNKDEKIFVTEIKRKLISKLIEYALESNINEASGFDGIFNELKTKLTDISMLPDNVIDAKKYKEHEITTALKSIGYEYKKPVANKLHFFNKKTSISLYLNQSDHKITLIP